MKKGYSAQVVHEAGNTPQCLSITPNVCWLHVEHVGLANLRNDLDHPLEDVVGHGGVHAAYHCRAAAGFEPPHLHGANVKALRAQVGAHLPDHPGNVWAGEEQHVALGSDIHGKAVHLHQAVPDSHEVGSCKLHSLPRRRGRHHAQQRGVVAALARLGLHQQPSVFRDGRGVDKVHGPRGLVRVQQALQEACGEGGEVHLAEPSDLQLRLHNGLMSDLSNQASQLLGNAQHVLHGLDKMGLHAGNVHSSTSGATLEHLNDLLHNVHRDLDLGLHGGGTQVRGQDEVGTGLGLQQGAVGVQGLGREDIQRGRCDVP
eukprot:RCo011673